MACDDGAGSNGLRVHALCAAPIERSEATLYRITKAGRFMERLLAQAAQIGRICRDVHNSGYNAAEHRSRGVGTVLEIPRTYFRMHQEPPAFSTPSPRSLIRQLFKSLKLVVLAGVVGALAGAAVSHFVPLRWAASMTVQIGQITTTGGPTLERRPIEEPLTVVDRYNLPSFRLRVVKDLGLPSPDVAGASREIFDSLNATQETSPNLIHLHVTAYSRQQAEAALRFAFDELSIAHRQLYDPEVDGMKREFDNSSRKLAAAEADYARGYQAIRSSADQGKAALDSARNILVTNMTTQINLQILQLKQQVALLQQALSPMNTYPTRVVEAPYAPLRPRSPSAKLLIAAGAILGLLVGAALALGPSVKRR